MKEGAAREDTAYWRGTTIRDCFIFFAIFNTRMSYLSRLQIKITVATLLLVISFGKAFTQNTIRPIEQLITDSSGWAGFKNATKIAQNQYEVLPADPVKAKDALYQTQVTTRSLMGAIIYFTGGILVDNGWIRILGSGSEKLPRSLPGWNKGKTYQNIGERPTFLLIADDAVGGFFAINAGGLGDEQGKVYYLAPDDLRWESLHIGYTDFINFCLVGNLNKFYSGLRWENWKADMIKLGANEGYSMYPYPWTLEGKDIDKVSKTAVPIQQLYDFETGELKKVKQ